MRDLSIIIPARNEEFLLKTIEDILAKKRANTEIIVILDGYWPGSGIPQHEDLTIVHLENPIGQRAATNYGAKLSDAKYIMKCDAHCMFDEGFDQKLMEDMNPDWVVVPRMHTLNAFEWVCLVCGHRHDQGAKIEECESCNEKDKIEREIVYKPRKKKTDYMWFDADLRVKYFDGPSLRPYVDGEPGTKEHQKAMRTLKKKVSHYHKPGAENDIDDIMCGVGACWFLEREYYWSIGGLDENHGSWGQMGVEIACKTWLSGGRHVVNKKTWFAHLFRTGGGFTFPYKNPASDQDKARKYSRDLWLNNKWDGQKKEFYWIINKFYPLPGWDKVMNNPKKPTKGIVYYTDNQCEERIVSAARHQLKRSVNGHEIVSVSQYPIDFGKNIVVNWSRSVLTMFKQILKGLEESNSDIIFLCEHDVLYHPSHFEFTPSRKDVYYFNKNVWVLDSKTGTTIHYDGIKQVSGLVAYRDFLIEHYKKRVERVEKEGFTRKMGFEPGKKLPHGIDNHKWESFISEGPNIDIKHPGTITKGRFDLSQYRCRERIKDSWRIESQIPSWGVTGNRFSEFLKEVVYG